MAITKEKMDKQLHIAQVAIDNALNDSEIQTMLAEYGYTAEKIASGKSLYEEAEQLHAKQKKEYGEQFSASDALEKAWEAAHKEYLKHVTIARIALKDDRSAFQSLHMAGTRKRSISGWLTQAKQFYTNSLGSQDILDSMAEFGITQEKLEAGQQLVAAVENANALQEKEKGEAQEATYERDRAFDSMLEWMHDFVEISRIALEDKPQLIERLGILER